MVLWNCSSNWFTRTRNVILKVIGTLALVLDRELLQRLSLEVLHVASSDCGSHCASEGGPGWLLSKHTHTSVAFLGCIFSLNKLNLNENSLIFSTLF